MITSFEPIIDHNCRIMILGTVPGEKSLQEVQYYAHNRNQFWKLIYNVFDRLSPDENYNDRKKFLLENGIALWDVIESCERIGSLDSDIKNAVPNDFNNLFAQYNNINYIFFNGGMAQKYFKKLILSNVADKSLIFYKIPSSSPTNTMQFNKKLIEWMVIKNFTVKQ